MRNHGLANLTAAALLALLPCGRAAEAACRWYKVCGLPPGVPVYLQSADPACVALSAVPINVGADGCATFEVCHGGNFCLACDGPTPVTVMPAGGETVQVSFGCGLCFNGQFPVSTPMVPGCAVNYCTTGTSSLTAINVTAFAAEAWCRFATIAASDAGAFDRYGSAVDVAGGAAIVGAPEHNHGAGPAVGAAYVQHWDGSAWLFDGELRPGDGLADDDFGAAVGVEGDWAIVGAPGDDNGSGVGAGSAYLFRRTGGGAWVQHQKLLPPANSPNRSYGSAVAIDGDTVVIGAPALFAGAAGFARVFLRDDLGTESPADDLWIDAQGLGAADVAAFEAFGDAVAIDAGWIVVGAPGDDDAGSSAGSAYVFARLDGGTPGDPMDDSWILDQKLYGAPPDPGAQFGDAVGVDGALLVVGSPFTDPEGSSSGSAQVFHFDGADWAVDGGPIVPLDGVAGASFGREVGISGGTVVIGTGGEPDGSSGFASAYLHRFDGGQWVEINKLYPPPGPPGSLFGDAVAIDGDLAIVGNPGHDAPGTDAGAALLFAGVSGLDCGGDGALDGCQVAAGDLPDLDGDFIPDACDCPWDINHDGTTGIVDMLLLLAQWGTPVGGPPDFDGDGTVGITDLLALLGGWGACD